MLELMNVAIASEECTEAPNCEFKILDDSALCLIGGGVGEVIVG